MDLLIQPNPFALLGKDDSDNIDSLLSRVSVKVEKSPSVAANQQSKKKKKKLTSITNAKSNDSRQNNGYVRDNKDNDNFRRYYGYQKDEVKAANNGKGERILSKEEAERLAKRELEAKKMTLKEYEKHVEEKKKLLESSLKIQEQRIIVDKDFESMKKIVGKKNDQESTFVKLVPGNNKLKKKVSMEKNDNNFSKSLAPNVRPSVTNRSEKRGEKNLGSVENGIGVPSIEDAEQFPGLGGVSLKQ